MPPKNSKHLLCISYFKFRIVTPDAFSPRETRDRKPFASGLNQTVSFCITNAVVLSSIRYPTALHCFKYKKISLKEWQYLIYIYTIYKLQNKKLYKTLIYKLHTNPPSLTCFLLLTTYQTSKNYAIDESFRVSIAALFLQLKNNRAE